MNFNRRTCETSESLGNSSDYSSVRSISTQNSLGDFDTDNEGTKAYHLPSDRDMLERARAAHFRLDFDALGAELETDKAWERVEVVDDFIVSKRAVSAKVVGNRLPGLDVVCTGHLDASLAEVASILRSQSELELANTLHGLYAKSFIFGTLDREIPCSTSERPEESDDETCEAPDQLNVKTTSFARTNVFARNEQWCFSELFQHNKDRETGFTISQCALPPLEPTPGRVISANARVRQLHGLNAAYRVETIPNQDTGLRIIYNVWFEKVDTPALSYELSGSSPSNSDHCPSPLLFSSPSSVKDLENIKPKAHLRRLLSLSHGITKLPELIRTRRYGFQVPANLETIQVANTRCPCCTHSLTPLKRSLSIAASALATKSLRALKNDTRRCYLCGYLVCIDCWRAESMESRHGRVASIVVCTRCHASVQACDYSHVAMEEQRPAQVVDDAPNESTAPLLTAFLDASFTTASTSLKDRKAIVDIVRFLLDQSEANETKRDTLSPDSVPIADLTTFLSDETQLPALETCVFASATQREYLLNVPDTALKMVPSSLSPHYDACRLKVATDRGLLKLAHELAPLHSSESSPPTCDVQDLDLLCQLAVQTTQCADAFLCIMGTEHNHVLAATHAGFLHAAVPRQETFCQHTILSTDPFMITHPEADARFHHIQGIKALSIRSYVGFPMIVQTSEEKAISVGTLCCIDSTAKGQLTRTQYTTMKRLAETASRLIQLKGQQLLQQKAA